MSLGSRGELAMMFGELVATIGAVEFLVLVLALAGMVARAAPRPSLNVEPTREPMVACVGDSDGEPEEVITFAPNLDPHLASRVGGPETLHAGHQLANP